MRISDWSSDVCSSDLGGDAALYRWTEIDKAGRRDHRSPSAGTKRRYQRLKAFCYSRLLCSAGRHPRFQSTKIGRASCRERVCQYVSISVVAVSLKINTTILF